MIRVLGLGFKGLRVLVIRVLGLGSKGFRVLMIRVLALGFRGRCAVGPGFLK